MTARVSLRQEIRVGLFVIDCAHCGMLFGITKEFASGCVDQLVQWTWKWWGVVDTTTASSERGMAWLRENVAREAP